MVGSWRTIKEMTVLEQGESVLEPMMNKLIQNEELEN